MILMYKKLKNSLATHQQELSYMLILIYQHLKQTGKITAGVELHVDSHLPTFETAWQHTKTSAGVELHVDSHLPTFETA